MSHTHSSYDQQAQGSQVQVSQVQASQAYVIEVGETQAGLVNRRPDERYFTFIAASAVFHALEGHRFATPGAAELAVRQLAAPRRHSATWLEHRPEKRNAVFGKSRCENKRPDHRADYDIRPDDLAA